MDNNTNQTATPEIKTEEVATKEKKVKAKKENKAKEPKEPIDKQDQLCYLGAMIFLILALLPTLLRNFDPNYDEYKYEKSDSPTSTTNVVKKTLICSKDVNQTGYSYRVEIEGYYEDDQPKSTNITYSLEITDKVNYTYDNVEITEYETLKGIQENGITSNEDEPTEIDGVEKKIYNINLNFRDNANLIQSTALDSHNKILLIQKDNYQNDGYLCITQ